MKNSKKEIENYIKLNKVAQKGGVVLFGSTFASSIPVCELKQTFHIENPVYNRSLKGLSVFDAYGFANNCIVSLFPKKILLMLGDADLYEGERTVSGIISEYERLIYSIRSNDRRCTLVVVSVCFENTSMCGEFNGELEKMAKRLKCQYADISSSLKTDFPAVNAFGMLKLFMLDRITFCDAMSI